MRSINGRVRLVAALLGILGLFQMAPQTHAQARHEGIQLHGHWTVDVRNPDGALAAHREFENELIPNQGRLLSWLLTGIRFANGWSIHLGDSANTLCADNCRLSTTVQNPTVYATSLNGFLLEGSTTALRDGEIAQVETRLNISCDAANPLHNCAGGGGVGIPAGVSGAITRAQLPTPIVVVSGQVIQVKVLISMS